MSTLLGEAVKPAPTPVVAQLATRVEDDVVVLSKKTLNQGSTATEFVLPLAIDAGQYRLALTAGSHSGTVSVRVLGKVSLQWLEAGLLGENMMQYCLHNYIIIPMLLALLFDFCTT